MLKEAVVFALPNLTVYRGISRGIPKPDGLRSALVLCTRILRDMDKGYPASMPYTSEAALFILMGLRLYASSSSSCP